MEYIERIQKVLMDYSESTDNFVDEWGFKEMYESMDMRKCMLCGHNIKNCVVIKNKLNNNELVIGIDCAELILQGQEFVDMETKKRLFNRYKKDLKNAKWFDDHGFIGSTTIAGDVFSNVEMLYKKVPEYLQFKK